MTDVALDTNILLSLVNNEPTATDVASALDGLRTSSRLLLSAPVYAELIGFYPGIVTLLNAQRIEIDPHFDYACWTRAGVAYAAYAVRRQRSAGGLPRRILPDFLIAAHASVRQASLFTLNPGDFLDFPEVPLLVL
ncbi:type II toxin-antitoxin system VapC family toxin [Deinococcus ruber]|uniref:PIN domain-containing protein n=1 Tax=Deinococcus ruber TaxID=1848197 RepID=A0A918CAE0_9DEIO|nr:type II toxin-antitoxin system VapC family toxin [Deinococcus ruber]GGR12797.1 PIN domain-containing protein [Deinococcus ruber]